VALQDLTEERRTLLHDSGQFAHTHSSMLKTMSDDCEAARRERGTQNNHDVNSKSNFNNFSMFFL
jgi:hypothetical protein